MCVLHLSFVAYENGPQPLVWEFVMRSIFWVAVAVLIGYVVGTILMIVALNVLDGGI